MYHRVFKLFFLTLFFTVTLSCDSEKDFTTNKHTRVIEKTITKSELAALNGDGSVIYEKTNSNQVENIYIRIEIQSTHPLIEFSSLTELENYVNQNGVEITSRLFVNDELWWNEKFESSLLKNSPTLSISDGGGSSQCGRDPDGTTTDSRECSSLGWNCCAWSVIDDWSTAKRIYESFSGGVMDTIQDCILRNCFGF